MSVLCRHGFLAMAPALGEQADRVRRYRRTATWPPTAKYLADGQIGFAYYLQTWFRYYLQRHMESAMSELEVKEGVYSLDFHRHVESSGDDRHIPNALGAVGNQSGQWWAATENLVTHKLQGLGGCDLSQMNLDWVAHTEDPIFSDLPRRDRYLLYLVFVRDFRWEQVADALQISVTDAKRVSFRLRSNPYLCHFDGGSGLSGNPRRCRRMRDITMINLTEYHHKFDGSVLWRVTPNGVDIQGHGLVTVPAPTPAARQEPGYA